MPKITKKAASTRTGQFGGTYGYKEPFNADGEINDDDDDDMEEDDIEVDDPSSSGQSSRGRGGAKKKKKKKTTATAAVRGVKAKANGKNRKPDPFESDDKDESEDNNDEVTEGSDDEAAPPNRSRSTTRKGTSKTQPNRRKRAADHSSAGDDDDDSSLDEDVADRSNSRSRRNRNAKNAKGGAAGRGSAAAATAAAAARRTSSRANKFTSSMADFPLGIIPGSYEDGSSSSSSGSDRKPRGRGAKSAEPASRPASRRAAAAAVSHVTKSPAKRHAKQRLSIRSDACLSSSEGEEGDDDDHADWGRRRRPAQPAARRMPTVPSKGRSSGGRRRGGESASSSTSSESEDDDDDRSEEADEEDVEEEEEPLKLERIIACRTETRARWREICQGIQTSEIESGSRWNQPDAGDVDKGDTNDHLVYEERFLVKWKHLSYLHCSWETQADLEGQLETAKQALAVFFRKSKNGLLYDSDERCDGDYFDPGWVQIDRILEVHLPEDGEGYPEVTTPEEEDAVTPKDFGIVLDRSDDGYEDGTGRQFLIKWTNLGYAEGSFEFERDLILNDVEYKSHVKSFLVRSTKPHRSEVKERSKKAEAMRRQLYKAFGDNSPIAQSKRDREVAKFKSDLLSEVHKNGGQLRDYQAEGVAWMISNYINKRGFILADEMGLGKTLQTATFVNYVKTEFQRLNPVLVIAPLSTLAHWRREFEAWTDLNVIIYHGSAGDRDHIRQLDFVFECDRPASGVAFNQTYLKKCVPKRLDDSLSPWMVHVVITTPEMITSEDSAELAAVPWEIVVCDEAHRMKNNSSKLTTRMKAGAFKFNHKVLLTGTPIQNDVTEFWTLLNFIDPEGFDDIDSFLDRYGDLKTKESIDELHEEIRPYILRRLKEDVETSVPPKEETIIEVELTADQKKYYRALYEKNVKFLYKGKTSAGNGPSLLNLAMQLRKCCNHLFLLEGVEEEFRASLASSSEKLTEVDVLVRASGKLVLLDKLLPRLQNEGHRVLLFSQFKIMLDVLEDYLHERNMKFERIDGNITGHKRQQAIDRFQAPIAEGKEPPFIMLLSTKAGGVGINLTAADTVVVFDSDFNPQNDLQAQARCHRIGQTKSVKVYRLMSSRTYEMQLFHMSSMKLGLDQAVLKGFESGSAEAALSKAEVERLLRHGAYDILSEQKAGTGDAESNAFVQQDIDTILERRSRTIVHENTGSKSNASGGTFSKASFKVAKSPVAPEGTTVDEDIDVEDPDFWKKMLGEPKVEDRVELDKASRRKVRTNYNESLFMQRFSQSTKDVDSDPGSSSYESDNSEADESLERSRWGGKAARNEWAKDDVESLVRTLCRFGYRVTGQEPFSDATSSWKDISKQEVERMALSLCLVAVLETYEEEVQRFEKSLEKKSEASQAEKPGTVDASATPAATGTAGTEVDVSGIEKAQSNKRTASGEDMKQVFDKIINSNSAWLSRVVDDAVAYAQNAQPRADEVIERVLNPERWKLRPKKDIDAAASFAQAWQSLKNRGWKAETPTTGDNAGKTRYEYEGKHYASVSSVLIAAKAAHPDLASMCDNILALQESSKLEAVESSNKQRAHHLGLRLDNVTPEKLRSFVEKYSPLQLVADLARSKQNRLKLRKVVDNCGLMSSIAALVERTSAAPDATDDLQALEVAVQIDKRLALPHPAWTSRHDAILIRAIFKHGWIDQSSSFRAIAEDSGIKWGPPFEVQDEVVLSVKPTNLDDVEGLRATAMRAATFINKNRELIEEFKGFNHTAVKRAYGLIVSDETGDSVKESAKHDAAQSLVWVVDESALVGASAESKGPVKQEPEDLPTAKDLLRRAKLLLSRCGVSPGAAPDSSRVVDRQGHDFAVLDQSDRCNIFLAELLRGLVKAKSSTKDNKKFCLAASQEATDRVKSIKELMVRNPSEASRLSKVLTDMSRIVQHLDLVLQNLQKSARQFKNVIRAILGLDLDPGRNPEEPMFPVVKAKPTISFTKKIGKDSTGKSDSSPGNGKRSISKADSGKSNAVRGKVAAPASHSTPAGHKTTGEIAIENSQGKLWSRRSQGGPFLQLTEIEIRILAVACSKGLPVWNDKIDWVVTGAGGGAGSSSSAAAGRSRPYALTWAEFARHVSEHAQSMLDQQTAKVSRLEDDIATRPADQLNAQVQAQVRYRLRGEEKTRDLRERAAEQAEDYENEPETLAKKTIMMLSKVREMAVDTPVASPKNGAKGKSGVVGWLRDDLRRWGRSFDVSDESGDPFPLTAADFQDEVGEEERSAIEVSSVLNVDGCWGVLEQVALMSRLRSVFLSCERGAKQRILEGAVDAIAGGGSSSKNKWASQPEWWAAREDDGGRCTLHHDQLLLERLMHSGFDGVLLDPKSYGVGGDVTAASVTFRHAGLNKAMIQQRATQLAVALHCLEASGKYAGAGGTSSPMGPSSPRSSPTKRRRLRHDEDEDEDDDDRAFAQSAKSDSDDYVQEVPAPKRPPKQVVSLDNDDDDDDDDEVFVVEVVRSSRINNNKKSGGANDKKRKPSSVGEGVSSSTAAAASSRSAAAAPSDTSAASDSSSKKPRAS